MSAEQDEVRRTLALYAHRHDSRDAQDYADLFSVEGSFVRAQAQHRGREAVREFIADLYRTQPEDRRTKHLCGNSVV
ncbi:MAG: nuclear transport factor 2 family protein [Chloroflexi bacterium]|nr:nuclear transport factor 2 family protein [Chloroflexota bacterium]